MATKQHKRIDSKGHEEIWEWEETPEVLAALANYWNTVSKNKEE